MKWVARDIREVLQRLVLDVHFRVHQLLEMPLFGRVPGGETAVPYCMGDGIVSSLER